ncbi:hypothetical protein M378DRAFT_169048 [Amanita muscaria Koide BX008]|uniref:Uncharacterized protein n=1 Tax=Amanita muscaria (strain Koide BX008) TaxID=946122 RepID=A0A0C2WTI8_AMAMK|nr:hypothetical protein M378DRAFT_169048 [Amanita muscaria Koide BX008]
MPKCLFSTDGTAVCLSLEATPSTVGQFHESFQTQGNSRRTCDGLLFLLNSPIKYGSSSHANNWVVKDKIFTNMLCLNL